MTKSTPILQIDKIVLKVANREAPILNEVTFDINPKEFVVFLGHNGSGKSTLVKILSGQRFPTSGTVSYKHSPLSCLSLAKNSTELVTLSQYSEDRLFAELTIEENIVMWESRFPADQQIDASIILSFSPKSERLLPALHQPVKTLSGGEKQVLLLALALAHPPEILFLDEPTASLDPRAAQEIMELTAYFAKKSNITTIMVTHRLEDALLYGDRIIILQNGSVIQDIKKDKDFSLSVSELREMLG